MANELLTLIAALKMAMYLIVVGEVLFVGLMVLVLWDLRQMRRTVVQMKSNLEAVDAILDQVNESLQNLEITLRHATHGTIEKARGAADAP